MNCRFYVFLLVISLFAGPAQAHAPAVNLFQNARVTCSSEKQQYPGKYAVDGIHSRSSTWISGDGARPPHLLEVTLPKYADLDSVVIYTGIPDDEKSAGERLQAAGFWGMKNFKLQYWDDANWTDIPRTETTENRRDRLSFAFSPAITTFRFRLSSVDGEPIRIIEFEGYGRVNPDMHDPGVVERTPQDVHVKTHRVAVRFTPDTVGRSMQYVGYNQGFYLPGSNISSWIEYSNINSMRLWADLRTYLPARWVRTDVKMESLADFERHKTQLRADPESCEYIDWDSITAHAARPQKSTNSMVFEYALRELKRLGVAPLLQINSREFDGTWAGNWRQWQRFYALAFYAAKTGDASMFAMHNEPNHVQAGPMKIETWLDGMRIVSDAVHCAVEDVNRLYGKHLKPRFVGPVTAGTNVDWWARIARAERIDYRGAVCDHDLIDIFSTHSYNLPAAGYVNKVRSIRRILEENHPLHLGKPIVFTEIGRWMNAYLIDKAETMDSPSLFTEWAGIYTNNMLNGCYGMWAFKMANTTSGPYPRGIKSGHLHIWKGQRIVEDACRNLASGCPATASDGSDAKVVTDGDKTDASAWRSVSDGTKWVEIDLEKPQQLCGAIVYTGSEGGVFTGPDRIRNSRMEAFVGGEWCPIAGTGEANCKYVQLIHIFEQPVTTDRVRFVTDDTDAKIREIKLFGDDILHARSSYSIGGAMRTAEVVRLFAKGFRDSRPLLGCERSAGDPDLDVAASVGDDGTHYVWIVQRNLADYDLELDFSELGIGSRHPVVCETVSGSSYGEASVLRTGEAGKLSLRAGAQSVMLLTVSPRADYREAAAVRNVTVWGDRASQKALAVKLNASDFADNAVTYLGFDAAQAGVEDARRIVLSVDGSCTGQTPYRFHVYLYGGDELFDERKICREDAPYLLPDEPCMREDAQELHIAGELTMTPDRRRHELDVTELARKYAGKRLTFVLIRETREPGDDADKDRCVRISSRRDREKPLLKIW